MSFLNSCLLTAIFLDALMLSVAMVHVMYGIQVSIATEGSPPLSVQVQPPVSQLIRDIA